MTCLDGSSTCINATTSCMGTSGHGVQALRMTFLRAIASHTATDPSGTYNVTFLGPDTQVWGAMCGISLHVSLFLAAVIIVLILVIYTILLQGQFPKAMVHQKQITDAKGPGASIFGCDIWELLAEKGGRFGAFVVSIANTWTMSAMFDALYAMSVTRMGPVFTSSALVGASATTITGFASAMEHAYWLMCMIKAYDNGASGVRVVSPTLCVCVSAAHLDSCVEVVN